MNVPPPKEIPRYRDQLAAYSAKQRAHTDARRAEAIRRARRIEEQVKQRELQRAHARRETREGRGFTPIWTRAPLVRGQDF